MLRLLPVSVFHIKSDRSWLLNGRKCFNEVPQFERISNNSYEQNLLPRCRHRDLCGVADRSYWSGPASVSANQKVRIDRRQHHAWSAAGWLPAHERLLVSGQPANLLSLEAG